MEQHPVPQNVTTFQFRLIGDMTIKQFGYLCIGGILAYISYKLPLPFFFTWPAAVFFALLGVGFAFVPVEERPMDVWVLSFFKSIYSPTQYIWSRKTETPVASPPHAQPASTRTQSTWFTTFFSKKQKISVPPVTAPIDLSTPPSVVKTQPEPKKEEVTDIQKQLSELLGQKRALEEELVSLKRKTMTQGATDQPTRVAGVVSAPTQPTINVIDPSLATKVGLPKLTTYPNVVTGITKDTMGNLLPSVLVTIRDKEGIPLRALKTNKLGQFAASTQLSPGTYLIEVEDPRGNYVFDRAQIVVNNTVLPTIEIIAKSQKEIERTKLAQQIFGNTL